MAVAKPNIVRACARHSDPGKLVGYTLSATRRLSYQQPCSRMECIKSTALARIRDKASRMGCIQYGFHLANNF